MTSLLEKVHALDNALGQAGLAHAFGGALALAFCTGEPRATVDIDCNVFVGPDRVEAVLGSLPDGVRWDDGDRRMLERDGQARLWWESTPVDLFLSTTAFHGTVASRVRHEQVAGRTLPFLSCADLAVFKAFFDRRKDWADLEAMVAAGSFDPDRVTGVLVRTLGPDDPRIGRLLDVCRQAPTDG